MLRKDVGRLHGYVFWVIWRDGDNSETITQTIVQLLKENVSQWFVMRERQTRSFAGLTSLLDERYLFLCKILVSIRLQKFYWLDSMQIQSLSADSFQSEKRPLNGVTTTWESAFFILTHHQLANVYDDNISRYCVKKSHVLLSVIFTKMKWKKKCKCKESYRSTRRTEESTFVVFPCHVVFLLSDRSIEPSVTFQLVEYARSDRSLPYCDRFPSRCDIALRKVQP